MAKSPSSRMRFVATVLMIGAAAVLHCAPENLAGAVRSALFDALRPGQRLLRSGAADGLAHWHRLHDATGHRERVEELEAQLAGAELVARRAQVQTALLHETLQSTEQRGMPADAASPGEPLFVPELLQAAVLGDGTRALWRAGKLLDKGESQGVVEESLVLDDARPLVEQGRTSGVEPEQDVYAGRCVVGRIASVGRWTSTVERVTDKGYRGLARLARQSSRGLNFLAEGILQGDGTESCRLQGISSTEAVEIGDDVYTGGRDGRLRFPMYYGKVVAAWLNDGGTAWEIRVQPAVGDKDDLETVQILRARWNPHRVAAQ